MIDLGKTLEIYKDIPGYEGKYQITTWGRVYSVDKKYYLLPEVHEKGYLRVDLYDKQGKRKHFKVHRLVANAFIPNPEHKPQVNHKDGNNQNNSITNLEWATNRENQDHANRIRRKNKKWKRLELSKRHQKDI